MLLFSYGQNKTDEKEAKLTIREGEESIVLSVAESGSLSPGAGFIACVRSHLPSFSLLRAYVFYSWFEEVQRDR